MKRGEFIKSAVGGCCGAAAMLGSAAMAAEGDAPSNPAETPCDRKVEFAKRWVARFMDVMDDKLDRETREGIMEENGRQCYLGAHGTLDQSEKPTFDEWVAEMSGYVGGDNIRREGNTVYFNYVGNGQGLKVADGYCLCPLVEDGPEKISGTYCHCSVGYVREMFSQHWGKPVTVELLAALRRGDDGCRFKVNLV